jgi:hypothetical protein
MAPSDSRLVQWFGLRGARVAIVLSGFLYFLLIVGGGALIVVDGLQAGRRVQAVFIGALALLAFVLWVRIVLTTWRSLRADAEELPAVSADETGIWGVGGPAMREPGSTGIMRGLRPPRADDEQD